MRTKLHVLIVIRPISLLSPTYRAIRATDVHHVHQPLSETCQQSPPRASEAHRRLREILAYMRGATIIVSPRSVQRWMVAYYGAEEHTSFMKSALLHML